MPQEIGNERRFVGPHELTDIESKIAEEIGKLVADVNDSEDFQFSYDEDKKRIIAERVSELGNVIEFFEVRVIVGYIGDGRYDG